MAPTLSELGPLEETLWLTLCGRAVDNRQPRPILGDTWADDIVRRFDYDDSRFGALTSPSSGLGIALRRKKLDKVVRDFTARHPNAVGLDLGCGLDSRVHCIDPPSTVDWYNIDFPSVIAARERALSERANTHGIAADLTEPGWLHGIPADRPAVAAYPPAVRAVARLASLSTRWGREAGGSVLHYRYERSEQPQE